MDILCSDEMTPLIHQRSSIFDLQPQDKVLVGDRPYIFDSLARGGMGCVFLFWLDPNYAQKSVHVLGWKLALKAVLPEAADAESIALFKRELTVWSGFRHRNIVTLLEIVDGGDAGWVGAMDWCLGSLRDILNERKRLSLEDSTYIIASLHEGLNYAYNEHKVLHLDLKPENVLCHLDIIRLMDVSEDEDDPLQTSRFMVSDWGIASIKQVRLNAIAGLPPTNEAAQRTFNNMGTILYMAPERFTPGVTSSIASDIFSLGMIYLEMLTGSLPFRADTHPVYTLLSQQYLKDSLALMRSFKVPKSIRKVIMRMIAFSPLDRPSDYSQLRVMLLQGLKRRSGFFSRFM